MSILEIIDDAYRPVPPGAFSSRILVTNLWARTLPLIRYEIPDRVRMAEDPCACGLPFARIADIDGRASEVLILPGADGRTVSVMPSQVQRLMAEWPVAGWQVVGRAEGRCVRITAAAALDREAMAQRLGQQLQAMGANGISVDVEIVPEIPLSSAGKTIRFVDAANSGRAISSPT